MSVTEKLLDHFRGEVKEVNLVTGKGGVFEVTVNGEKIYSKKETGQFPNPKDLILRMEQMNG